MDIRKVLPGEPAAVTTHEPRDGTFAGTDAVPDGLEDVLAAAGADELYAHQARALEHGRDGNVVVATPTASGKSLVYILEALRRAKEGKRTLYVAPTNALVNDQAGTFTDLAAVAGMMPSQVQTYTGQLSRDRKRAARNARPLMVLSNVDMLHMSMLPYARRSTWDWFFSSLDLVVVDELHYYRGVLGSQVAILFRRLQRMLDHHGVSPDFIAASATIGNPVEHARAVTGAEDWTAVTEDASRSGTKHWAVLDNAGSPHPKAKRVSENLIRRDVQTLTFAGARQLSEQYIRHLQRDLREAEDGDVADRVKAYHAALDDDRREELEEQIKAGELQGVWATNALELGVDIGTLDAVVMDGYPGSRMNVQQQAGRAGRGSGESYVVLVPGEDNLDQYIKDNPEELFGAPEDAKVNPGNPELLARHLELAARELPLSADDPHFPNIAAGLERAEADGLLVRDGDTWEPARAQDGPPFQIRNVVDRSVALIDRSSQEVLTELNYEAAITDAYPGAIYYHDGSRYEVEEFDRDNDAVYLSPLGTNPSYFTDPNKEKSVRIEEELEREEHGPITVLLCDVTVDGSVVGYYRKDKSDQRVVETHEFPPGDELPFEFRTRALAFTFDATPDVDALGDGLHAAEHTMIGVLPLHVLCDRRNDLGGLSTRLHADTGKPTIFVHEGHPGGVGLVDDAHAVLPDVVDEARSTIAGCTCRTGCGSCIYSPTCGNANRHLDKDDGLAVLDFIAEALPEPEDN